MCAGLAGDVDDPPVPAGDHAREHAAASALKTPRRLTSMVRHQSSGSFSHIGPIGPAMPALLTSRSSGPSAIFEFGDRPRQLHGVGHVGGHVGGRCLRCRRSAAAASFSSFGRAGDEGDRRARVGEGVREHQAETATAAGDECNRAGQRLATGCRAMVGEASAEPGCSGSSTFRMFMGPSVRPPWCRCREHRLLISRRPGWQVEQGLLRHPAGAGRVQMEVDDPWSDLGRRGDRSRRVDLDQLTADFYRRAFAADPALSEMFTSDPAVQRARFAAELDEIVRSMRSMDAVRTRSAGTRRAPPHVTAFARLTID